MEKPIADFLAEGFSLHDIGINNWGLTREQALIGIEAFQTAGIPILGGEVYWKEDGKWVLSYDNWYCNRKESETFDEYIQRCAKTATDYITNYQSPNSEDILFALVYPAP